MSASSYVVLRRCVAPVSFALALEQQTLALSDEPPLDDVIARATDALFSLIGAEPDPGRRRRLLGLKRDLHNRRPSRGSPSSPLPRSVDLALEAIALQECRREALEQAYLSALDAERRILREVADSRFLDGVAASSIAFAGEVEAWRLRGTAERRDLRVELGVLKYAMRAATKTTPRAPWTATGLGHPLGKDGLVALSVAEYPSASSLLPVLERIVADETLVDLLPLRLNPSIVERGSDLVFVATEGAAERLRHIVLTPALREVVRLAAGGPLFARQLSAALELSAEESSPFLCQLVALGVLEVVVPVDVHGPSWPTELSSVLSDLPCGQSLRSRFTAIARALGGPDRRRCRLEIARVWGAIGEELELSLALAARPEDTVTEELHFEHVARIDDDTLSRVTGLLSRLGAASGPPLPSSVERRLLSVWETLGWGEAVDLVTAYEGLSAAKGREPEPTPVWKLREPPAGDVVEWTSDDLLGLRSHREPASGRTRRWAAFLQDREGQSVVDVIVADPACRFAPFATDPKIRRGLVGFAQPGVLLAELRDRSSVDVNRAPCGLLEAEIEIPGLAPRSDRLLRVADLTLFRDDDRVVVVHRPTGQEVLPVFLGRQSRCRSGLVGLLRALSGSEREHAFFALRRRVNEQIASARVREQNGARFPRLTFEGLVLQRRTWVFPARSLPMPSGGDRSRYAELRRWQRDQGLPERLFVRIADPWGQREPSARPDDHKPQMISFSSALLSKLFLKIVSRTPRTLWLSEIAPDLPSDPAAHLEEWIVAWEEP